MLRQLGNVIFVCHAGLPRYSTFKCTGFSGLWAEYVSLDRLSPDRDLVLVPPPGSQEAATPVGDLAACWDYGVARAHLAHCAEHKYTLLTAEDAEAVQRGDKAASDVPDHMESAKRALGIAFDAQVGGGGGGLGSHECAVLSAPIRGRRGP